MREEAHESALEIPSPGLAMHAELDGRDVIGIAEVEDAGVDPLVRVAADDFVDALLPLVAFDFVQEAAAEGVAAMAARRVSHVLAYLV